jgi:HSP20 family protein
MFPTVLRRVDNRWEDPISVMQREFDRAFNRLQRYEGEGELTGAYPVDIREDQDRIYVDAEMPGFTKDQVHIMLEQGVLTITGERKAEQTEGEKHLTERRFTRVSRSFNLPTTVDESKVQAKLEDGVLHLTIEKKPEVKPRRIEIQ